MTRSTAIKRPPFLRFVAEHFRIWRDLSKSYSFYKNFTAPAKGDGHPVLVIPGFMASDRSTNRLRHFVQKIGYQAYDWKLGRNYGNIRDVDTIAQQLLELNQKHQQTVSIIGWSLGGVYARQLAKNHPEQVRQVITLASPFNGINEPNNAVWLYRLIHRGEKVSDLDQAWIDDLPKPAPVPTTALYSKQDGIVPWEVCLENVEDDLHQNVEVHSSHLGMGFDPAVWEIVADRLQYDRNNWQAYRPQTT
ncbi:MAG: alpha/beta fold hydrolase [Bacteroidota bacterium]